MNKPPVSPQVILLVEDDRLALSTLSQGLERSGFAVITAESAEDAEDALTCGEHPDLAILDVQLPGKSGLELARRLQTLEQIPFIFLTAYGDEETVQQATACGALGFLVKPVDLPQVLPAIRAALAKAEEIGALRITHRQLQEALNNEREVSVATGITMVQYRLERKAAFELLRKTARSQNKKLAVLAAEIVKAVETLGKL